MKQGLSLISSLYSAPMFGLCCIISVAFDTEVAITSVCPATKAAVEVLTSILSKELRGRSITVNTVAPGPTATDLFLKGKPPELVERMAKMAPLERLGSPQDIAASVSFLAGPDGAWVNGQTLRVNGGIV